MRCICQNCLSRVLKWSKVRERHVKIDLYVDVLYKTQESSKWIFPWEGTGLGLLCETIKECTSDRGSDITGKLGGGRPLKLKVGDVFVCLFLICVCVYGNKFPGISGDGKVLAISLTVCRGLDRLTVMGSKARKTTGALTWKDLCWCLIGFPKSKIDE